MMLKHVEVDSSRFGALLLFSVSMLLQCFSMQLLYASLTTPIQQRVGLQLAGNSGRMTRVKIANDP